MGKAHGKIIGRLQNQISPRSHDARIGSIRGAKTGSEAGQTLSWKTKQSARHLVDAFKARFAVVGAHPDHFDGIGLEEVAGKR